MIDNMSTLKKLVFLYHIVASKTKEVIKTITDAIPPIIFHAIAKPIVSLIQKGKMELVPVTYNTAITQYGKNEFVPKAYVDTITQEGKCVQSNLPKGFTELDYLQSNGSQLLELPITRQSGKAYAMQADIEASVFGQTSSGLFTLGSDYAGYCVISRKWGDDNMVMMSGSVLTSGLVYTGRATYTVSVATDGLSCTLSDGTNTASFTRTTANYTNKPILFGLDAAYKGTCKIYSVKLWEDGTLKFDLVPCMNADGVCGMYNRVDGSFIAPYLGSLIAGDAVKPTPEHPVDIVTNNGTLKVRRQSGSPLLYQAVEWLKPNNGVTITGFKTKSTQEITAVFYRESTAAAYVYWSDTSSSGTTNTTAYITNYGNWRWDGRATAATADIQTKTTSVQSAEGIFFNGEARGSYTNPGEFVSNNDLTVSSQNNTSIRIHSMTVREGDIVTLDLVPKQRITDGVYGFYDKVSGNFYTNPDATFEAGDLIDDPIEIYTDGTPEELTVSGAQMLDPSTVPDENKYINYTTGTATAPSSGVFRYSGYIPVKEGTKYYFGMTPFIASAAGLAWYSTANPGSYISGMNATTLRNTDNMRATAPAGAKYLRFSWRIGESYDSDWKHSVYVCECDSNSDPIMTAWRPYVTAQTVANIPMLLGVGDYKDTAELIQGIKTGRVGVKVLDGTEDFTVSSGSMITTIPDVAIGTPNVPLNTHFALETSPTSITAGTQRFGANGSVINSRNYYMKHPTITTVPEFKTWLVSLFAAGTPVIVVYPLATETTEQIAQQIKPMPSPVSVSYTAEIDDITITTTQSTHTDPMPYAPLDILANNGPIKWNGSAIVSDGDPEVLTVGSTTVSVPNLFALGDIQDTKEFISGLVTHKIGVKVLNGSDTWSLSDGVFTTALSDASASVHQSTPPICERFVGVNGSVSASNMPEGSIRIAQNQTLGSSAIFIKSALFADAASLNAFLTEYPCIVLYALSNTTTETVDPHPEFSIGAASISYSQLSGISLIVTRDDVSVPTPYTPVFYKCNNGILKWNGSSIITDGTPEELTVSADGEETQTASVPMLLGVGEYKDEVELISGLLTHRIGVKVLDGTENWSASGNLFYAGIATDALKDTHSCYCTHFKGLATNVSATYDNEIKVGTNVTSTVNWTRVQIYPVVGTYDSVTALKQYLADQYAAGTPVIVFYPLATETTESVTPQVLNSYEGENVLDISAEVDDITLSISYYSEE